MLVHTAVASVENFVEISVIRIGTEPVDVFL